MSSKIKEIITKLSDKFKSKVSKTGDKLKKKYKRETDFASGLVSKSLRDKRKKKLIASRKK